MWYWHKRTLAPTWGITGEGEVTPQQCGVSLAKLGFVWGVGLLGDALGGPIGGFVLSNAAEKLLNQMDEINSTPPLETQPGYENIDINLQKAFN
jgi:hypothetical protein